jgi:hypothetical protein
MSDVDEARIRSDLLSLAREKNASEEEAYKLAGYLFALYPARDMASQEGFIAGVFVHFANHPLGVGRAVVDPLHGLPSRLKFLPSISEIAEALEVEEERRRGIIEKAERRLESLSFRKPYPRSEKPDFDTRRRIVKNLIKQGLLPESALLPLPPGRKEVDE